MNRLTGVAFLLIGIWFLVLGAVMILLSIQLSSAAESVGMASAVSGWISFLWALSFLKLIIGFVCLITGGFYFKIRTAAKTASAKTIKAKR